MSRSSAAPEMISLSFLLYISLISGNLVPSSSIFLPIRGLGTKLEIWSVISMKSPALKPAFTPPDAFVRKKHLCTQHSHKSCRKHNVLHCIALIIMHSALHYNNRHFANISENELTLMTLYR